MNVVNRIHRGKQLQVVYNCPCDPCSNRNYCRTQRMYCSAFTEYVNHGWYELPKVGKRLKKL